MVSGLGVYLWEQVAKVMGGTFVLIELPLGDMLQAIAEDKVGQAQVGVSCLSITADCELTIDFSHSFHETYVGIAVKNTGFLETIKALLGIRRKKRTIAEVCTYRTAVAEPPARQIQSIPSPIHARRTSFQPLEAQFLASSQ
jgi:hypothetical protein